MFDRVVRALAVSDKAAVFVMALEPLLAECGLPYIGGQVAQRGAATPGMRDPKLFPRRGFDLGEDLSMIGLERALDAAFEPPGGEPDSRRFPAR